MKEHSCFEEGTVEKMNCLILTLVFVAVLKLCGAECDWQAVDRHKVSA